MLKLELNLAAVFVCSLKGEAIKDRWKIFLNYTVCWFCIVMSNLATT